MEHRLPNRRRLQAVRLAAALVAASLLGLRPSAAQQLRSPKSVSLSSLTAQGFEVKAATGTQSGVVSTLVLQKDKDVYLCGASDLSIQPTAFACWPVK
jgi:alpha-tubulin suppressor-like RCC1 family protein